MTIFPARAREKLRSKESLTCFSQQNLQEKDHIVISCCFLYMMIFFGRFFNCQMVMGRSDAAVDQQ